jgi:hypothetical protein
VPTKIETVVTTPSGLEKKKDHTVPPEMKPHIAGIQIPENVNLPSLVFKNETEACLKIEEIPKKIASELTRQRYAPPFFIFSVGATEAADLSVSPSYFKQLIHSLTLQVPLIIRERLPNWVQPYGVLKIIFLSIPMTPNIEAFTSHLSEKPVDRRSEFNTILKAIAHKTGHIFYDRGDILDGNEPDRYRLQTEFDAYHPSREAAQEITFQVARIIYKVVLKVTPPTKTKRKGKASAS